MRPLDVISYAYVDGLADQFGWTSDFGPTLARSVASVILPQGSPGELLRVDEQFRLQMPVGLIALKGQQRAPAEVNRELFDRTWRHPNADVHEALFIVAMREGQRGARPLPKGEKPLIPRFGWWFNEGGFAHPIAKVVGAYRTEWEDDLCFWALDPFTGERFPILGVLGLRSPDRTPKNWRGSSYYYLA